VTTRLDLRQHLLDLAESRLIEHGYRALGVDDLATAAGISKKTLYATFESKEAIAEAVIDRLHDRIDAHMAALFAEQADPIETLRRGMAFVAREVARWHGPFLADLKRQQPQLWRRFDERRAHKIARLEHLIAQGQADGLFRAEVHPGIATSLYLAAIREVADPERIEEGRYTIHEALENVVTIFIEGIRVQL
jgi:AcrR family transcriptional regulator